MFKKILIGIAALLALSVIAIAVLVMRFDPNRYKDTLTALVKEKKQRTLKIDGSISLAFWPKLGVALDKASLSERNSEAVFARIGQVRLSLALMPLLRKELVVDRIQLEDVEATLVRDKAGHSNIDDLMAKEEASKDDAGATAMKFDIAGITLENANLTVRDDSTGQRASLRKVDLSTGRIAEGIPIDLKLRADFENNQPQVAGNIAAKGGVQFDATKGRYGFDKLDVQINGNGFGIRDLKLAVSGNVAIDAPGQRIESNDLKVRASGNQTTGQFELALDASKLLINPQGASGNAITGSAKLNGAQTVNVKFNASGVSGNAQAFTLAKLGLEFQMKEGQREINGDFSSPLRGNIETMVFELPTIAANLTVTDPTLPQKTIRLPLTGKLHADVGKQSVTADLAASLHDSKLQATLGVVNFSAPALNFDVAVDQINVDRYLPVAPKGDATPAAAATPEKPIDLAFLKALKLNGSLRVGALQAQGIKANDVVINTRAAGGRLDVGTISANLYQGTLNGSASVTASNQFALKQNLTNIAIGPLMKDALNRDLLEGRGNIVLDVNSAGNTVTAIKRGLNGSGSVKLRDGAIKGINLAQTLRDFKSKITLQKNEAQSADKNAKTDFTEMSASLTIKNGVASNNDLTAKSPFLRLSGTGDIDIGQGSMNYLAKAMIVNTASGQDGKDLQQLKDVAIPVRIVGPFEKLSYEVQWMAISSELLKNNLKDKLNERLTGNKAGGTTTRPDQPAESPQDKLKQGLKGLFGR